MAIAPCSRQIHLNFLVYYHSLVFCSIFDTEQILRRQVLRARFVGSILIFTSRQMWESNLGRLGEKRKRYLCAMPSPILEEDVIRFKTMLHQRRLGGIADQVNWLYLNDVKLTLLRGI